MHRRTEHRRSSSPGIGRIDWSAERDRIDLAAVATRLLGPAPGRRGERGRRLWWHCPFHKEDNNPSFCVDPGKPFWRCFGCGEHGDAFDLARRLDPSLSFLEAVAVVTGRSSSRSSARLAPARPPERRREPPAARIDPDLVEAAQARLWAPEGAESLADLRGRGLADDAIRRAALGLSDGSGGCPAGVTIPWRDGAGWRFINVRRPQGSRPKYLVHPRGARKGGIYPGPDAIELGLPLVVVEGELDALLLAQELAGLASVMTLGSASDRPTMNDLTTMLSAPAWFLAHDADEAGDRAAAGWSGRIRRVRPPAPFKDWGEAFAAVPGTVGTGLDLRRWWSDVLAGNPAPPTFTHDELEDWRWGPAVGDPEPGIGFGGPSTHADPEAD